MRCVLVLCLCAMTLSGCGATTSPKAKTNASRACVADYQKSLAASLRTVASEIDDKATAETANKRLGELWRDDRLEAFKPLTDRIQREIGGESWDPDKAAKLFKKLATELDGKR